MRLTKHGIKEWLGSGIIAAILVAASIAVAMEIHAAAGIITAISVFIVWLAIAAFFRVPNRRIPQGDELILSPADGVVRDIGPVNDPELKCFGDREMLRVGIFLSVFDVHVNRAPAEMTVSFKYYRKGRYLDARDKRASKENEAMTIAGTASAGGRSFMVGVKQISGAIAKRIVCPVEVGDSIPRGEIYGMIKFGSRTELFLPNEDFIKLNIKIGDTVRAGTTVIAKVSAPQQ